MPHTQVVLPLAPGVESVWQPVQEELDEAMATVRDVLDENLDNLQVGSAARGCRELVETGSITPFHLQNAGNECAGAAERHAAADVVARLSGPVTVRDKQPHSLGIFGHHQASYYHLLLCRLV